MRRKTAVIHVAFILSSFFVLVFSLFTRPVFASCPDPNDPSCPGFKIPSPADWLKSLNPGSLFPTGGIDDFIGPKLVPFIIGLLLFLVIIISLIFLIIGGVSWMTSGGNKEGLAKAKATLTYALVGLVLGLGSFIILNVVGELLGVKFF